MSCILIDDKQYKIKYEKSNLLRARVIIKFTY
jgi:hypothetical protein